MAETPVSIANVLQQADRTLQAGDSPAARVWATGFSPLDSYLNGGLRAGELTLLGGPQGLGKTAFALQMLRNVVAAGGEALYFSFEHDEETVLERLIAIESLAAAAADDDAIELRLVRKAMQSADKSAGSLADRLSATTAGKAAVASLADYGERLLVHRSSGALTSNEVIGDLVRKATKQGPSVVVVDYLQKIPVPNGGVVEDERVTIVVEALKDLALSASVPILAIVAADREGITSGKRVRTYHLRGGSALAYEADCVLVMNDKFDVVARHHLVYNVASSERFRDWVVVSIEKNRSGMDRIDLEFRKRLAYGGFDPDGQPVAEQLVDERVYVE